MMRPQTSVLVLGHPLVALPGLGCSGVTLWMVSQTPNMGLIGVFAFGLGCWVLNCAQVRARYVAWRKEWDELDPNFVAPTIRGGVRTGLNKLAVALALIGAFWLYNDWSDPQSSAHAVAPFMICARPALAVLRCLFRSRPKRQRTRKASPNWKVTQAISRPLSAPSAAEAYARLPDYCRPLFTSAQRKVPA